MPIFSRGDVHIHYEVTGRPDGPAVLLIAPGGMRSAAAMWSRLSWDPRARLVDHRVIAMDQRNAGASRAPVRQGDGWDTYTADQLALLDHLGVERFDVVGMCIGGAYIMGLIRHAPARVRSAVMFQPIGLDDNRDAFYRMFDGWVEEIGAEHPEADASVWEGFKRAMFGGTFLFNADRDEVAACRTPLMLLQGDDLYHPKSVSEELAGLASDVTVIECWKAPERVEAAGAAVLEFLTR